MDKKISELQVKETIEGEERIPFAYQGSNGAIKASSFVSKTAFDETIGDISSLLDQINGDTGTVTPIGYVKMGDTTREFSYVYYTNITEENETVVIGRTAPASNSLDVLGSDLVLWITHNGVDNLVMFVVNDTTYTCENITEYSIDFENNTISIHATESSSGLAVDIKSQGIPFVELQEDANTLQLLATNPLSK